MATVAVLLAAYNGMAWIEEQLESIIKQNEVTLDVFISVDLSDDGTYEWCKTQEKKYSNLIVLDYGERFGGAAKNFFRLIRDVDFSTYDYIALADQDDIWVKNKLSHAISVIQKDDLDAYSSDVIAFWNDGREKVVIKSYPQKLYDYYFEAAGPGCTYVFKQSSLSCFKKFLSENWMEVNQVALHDWMIYSYFRNQKMKWYIDSNPRMLYRQHEYNQVGLNSGFSATLKRLGMIKSKWYICEINKIYDLVSKQSLASEFSLNKFFLMRNFFQLRRRTRDAVVLLLFIVLGIF